MELPQFKYHPDPVTTGSIVESDETCECCGKQTGYLYDANIYTETDVQYICPWCIADGSAAEKFHGQFSDDTPLADAEVSDSIIDEVTQRTPGYNSWQQDEWESHCNDACAFHGEASKVDIQVLQGKKLQQFLSGYQLSTEEWQEILDHYEPGGDLAIFKFVCLHCGEIVYTLDFA